jgi:DNA-binding SARP family transcriptional activator
MLRIRLLGECHLAHDGLSITSSKSDRQQSLLAYLLLHTHASLSRQHLYPLA